MIEKLIATLESTDLPVFLQGSLSENDQYPDHFFTYWNNDSFDLKHFDNQKAGVVWDFDVNMYSHDPRFLTTMTIDVINLLKSAGFIVSGAGYSVASDEPTHTGRGFNAMYIQRNK